LLFGGRTVVVVAWSIYTISHK